MILFSTLLLIMLDLAPNVPAAENTDYYSPTEAPQQRDTLETFTNVMLILTSFLIIIAVIAIAVIICWVIRKKLRSNELHIEVTQIPQKKKKRRIVKEYTYSDTDSIVEELATKTDPKEV